jgi:hypothetical protein
VTRVNDKPGKAVTQGQAAPSDSDLSTSGRELFDLLVDYTKQETIEPLRGLGRYIGFGAIGSILVALGSTLLVIGVLRVLQTETGTTFTGNWSWVPYLLTLLVAGLIIALSSMAIRSASTPGEKAARKRDRSDRKEH